MIEFACAVCGQRYAVPDAAAGRTARCACGAPIAVPDPSAAPVGLPAGQSPPVSRLPVRTRRLLADAREMGSAFADFPPIHVRPMIGEPPEAYQIEYRVRGLGRGRRGPIPREQHVVEIHLTADYPRLGPRCRMLTPVFHPNIDAATICVADHWTAGERLVDLVVRIGEMLAYQAYNIKSPLDAQAAMWADLNAHQLPIDRRNLRPPELEQ
jgi:ubiquitin-protein ligase